MHLEEGAQIRRALGQIGHQAVALRLADGPSSPAVESLPDQVHVFVQVDAVPAGLLHQNEAGILEGDGVVQRTDLHRAALLQELARQDLPLDSIRHQGVAEIREGQGGDPLSSDVRNVAEGDARLGLPLVVQQDIGLDAEVVGVAQHPEPLRRVEDAAGVALAQFQPGGVRPGINADHVHAGSISRVARCRSGDGRKRGRHGKPRSKQSGSHETASEPAADPVPVASGASGQGPRRPLRRSIVTRNC